MATSAKAGIEERDGLAAALDVRFANASTNERGLLIALFVLIYVAYGALGRDVFVNHNEVAGAGLTDPIGRVLPFVRLGACAVATLLVVTSGGLTWALSKVPLLFAPFCLLALMSSAWSDDPKTTFQNALVLTMLWIGLSMVVHRLGLVQTVRSSIHIIAAVMIVSAALAILVPSVGQHSGLELSGGVAHIGRWRGIFSHKNGLGPWAAYGSVFLFTHSWLCSGPRLYWWLARGSAVACLSFSGSATAIVRTTFLMTLCCGFLLMILVSTLVVSITESNLLIRTGLDGPIAFGGCTALLTTRKSPDARLRGEFRSAKSRL